MGKEKCCNQEKQCKGVCVRVYSCVDPRGLICPVRRGDHQRSHGQHNYPDDTQHTRDAKYNN